LRCQRQKIRRAGNESEYIMVIADQPNMPPIVMLAQANQHTISQREHILGICQLVGHIGNVCDVLNP
jgi:hypothetical protein